MSGGAVDSINVSGELMKLYDVQGLPLYEQASSYQISSFDSTGGNDDGFNGTYSFLRRNSDSTLLIFDTAGPGVIQRIWTPTPTEDTLDFYIDDPARITFSIKYSDLFSGQVYPFISPVCGNELGGYFCYFPIPYQKSCKIVCRGKKLQFHQIQFKTHLTSAHVKSISFPLNEDEKRNLESLKEKWNNPTKDISNYYDLDALKTAKSSISLSPGEKKLVFEYKNGGRILGIEMNPSDIFSGLDKQIDIIISWDDEQPAVNIPVADFFGYAFGKPSMQSYLLGSQANKNYCYFPMPFDKSAQIWLNYRKSDQAMPLVNIEWQTYYSETPRNPATEGKFYTEWNRDSNPAPGTPHYFLDRDGKGHLVGTILQAQGLKAGMTLFFEGDDSTAVDGKNNIHGMRH